MTAYSSRREGLERGCVLMNLSRGCAAVYVIDAVNYWRCTVIGNVVHCCYTHGGWMCVAVTVCVSNCMCVNEGVCITSLRCGLDTALYCATL